jgi:hypothetical protein
MDTYSKINRNKILETIEKLQELLGSSKKDYFDLEISSVHPTEGYVIIERKTIIET